MKRIARLTALTLITFLATAVFAADGGAASKQTLTLSQTTSIAGVKLEAGDYKLFVTRDGDSAKVRITSGSKELVNTSAQFKEMSKFVGDVVLARNSSNEVVELQSKKLKGALVFNPQAGAATQGNSK